MNSSLLQSVIGQLTRLHAQLAGLSQLRAISRTLLVVVLLLLVGYVGIWQWMICRVEVPAGSSLLVRYKGPWPFGSTTQAPEGTLVKVVAGRPLEVGILENMPGPGRHFYSPLEYETQLVPDQLIPPGKIGVVVSKIGKPLPEGAFLVDDKGFRGILRKVLTPGRYRINTYAFDVKIVDVDACAEPATRVARKNDDPTLIPPGYVGVVTNKANDPVTGQDRGIQQQVLQPGIYFLNPEEKRIDIVSIGYSETSLTVEVKNGPDGSTNTGTSTAAANLIRDLGDRLGTSTADDPIYAPGKGIEFPSSDGFPIHLDYTAIWGILPEQAPMWCASSAHLRTSSKKSYFLRSSRFAGSTGRGGERWTFWWVTRASNSRSGPPPSWSESCPPRTCRYFLA